MLKGLGASVNSSNLNSIINTRSQRGIELLFLQTVECGLGCVCWAGRGIIVYNVVILSNVEPAHTAAAAAAAAALNYMWEEEEERNDNDHHRHQVQVQSNPVLWRRIENERKHTQMAFFVWE